MSKSKIIAKVFLALNNEVYIITHYNQIILATARNLLFLFSNPIAFIQNGISDYQKANQRLGVKSPCLDISYGVTLATISGDNTIVIESPLLFGVLTRQLSNLPDYKLTYEISSENTIVDNNQGLIDFLFSLPIQKNNKMPTIQNVSTETEKSTRIVFEYINALSNTSFNDVSVDLNECIIEADLNEESEDVATAAQNFDDDGYLTLKEYAEYNNFKLNTVRSYYSQGKYISAKKNENGFIVIHKNDVAFNKGKQNRPMPRGKTYKATRNFDAASYTEVQEYIQYHNWFSIEAGAYIRTIPELYYYLGEKYKEVDVNGRPAFIIDINPDYIVKGNNDCTGKSNRELIKNNMSPIVPGSENGADFERYQLHHVGQSSDAKAPFAVIPESDHIRTYFKVFHNGSSGNDLHDKGFEVEKKTFWQNYLRLFDEYKEFKKIPCKNTLIKRQSEADELKEKVRAFVSKEG